MRPRCPQVSWYFRSAVADCSGVVRNFSCNFARFTMIFSSQANHIYVRHSKIPENLAAKSRLWVSRVGPGPPRRLPATPARYTPRRSPAESAIKISSWIAEGYHHSSALMWIYKQSRACPCLPLPFQSRTNRKPSSTTDNLQHVRHQHYRIQGLWFQAFPE